MKIDFRDFGTEEGAAITKDKYIEWLKKTGIKDTSDTRSAFMEGWITGALMSADKFAARMIAEILEKQNVGTDNEQTATGEETPQR
jgi:hypothetical protein